MVFRVSFVVFRVSFVVFRVSFVVFRVSFVAFYRVSFVTTPCFNRGQAVVKGLNREQFDYDVHLCFSMIKCLRARRGNVHRKQNCFRGVLLFKTHFAEFCVKSV